MSSSASIFFLLPILVSSFTDGKRKMNRKNLKAVSISLFLPFCKCKKRYLLHQMVWTIQERRSKYGKIVLTLVNVVFCICLISHRTVRYTYDNCCHFSSYFFSSGEFDPRRRICFFFSMIIVITVLLFITIIIILMGVSICSVSH